MIDLSKKHLKKRDDDHPNIGNFVHWFIKQQNVMKKEVAKDLGIVPTTLNQYFKQHSIQFSILWRISRAINYNMVMDLGERLKIDYETKKEKELMAQLAEKEAQIRKMETKMEMQTEMYEKLLNRQTELSKAKRSIWQPESPSDELQDYLNIFGPNF